MPKITVLIPVYNCRDYLAEAIESVRNQTFTDIEIMICNNGSTDGSLEIAEAAQLQDSRIVIRSHANIGQGPSLVDGLKAARGEYIAEVDADDKIKPEMFEKMLECIERHNADVVKCHYTDFGEGWVSEKIVFPQILHDVDLNVRDVPDRIKSALICRPPCIFCGLYRKDFLLENELFFRADRNYEDTSLAFKIAVFARNFVWYDEHFYWHRADNPNSGTNTLKDFEAISEQYDEIRRVNDKFRLGLDKWNNAMMYYTYQWMYSRCQTDDERIEFIRIMRRDFRLYPAEKAFFNSEMDFKIYEIIGGFE